MTVAGKEEGGGILKRFYLAKKRGRKKKEDLMSDPLQKNKRGPYRGK